MKVSELIEVLSKYKQDLEVEFTHQEKGCCYEFVEVERNPINRIVIWLD